MYGGDKRPPPPLQPYHHQNPQGRPKRRCVDYTSSVVRFIQTRMWQRDSRDGTVLQPTPAAVIDMLPAAAHLDNSSTNFAAKFAHTSLNNRNRCSINRVLWSHSGRRLITGSQSGEFTLWNDQTFSFVTIIQAHDRAVRSMVWSYGDSSMVTGDDGDDDGDAISSMVTGDDGGAIKCWNSNLKIVEANKSAHKESVRDLSFCRTDLKFCSCSDDTTVKVWDINQCQKELYTLSGHGWDVKSVDWHPTKSLLASGGKDNLVKLWDARSGRELCTFYGHKNTVLCVKWNQNGNWILTSSKDQTIKLYDIRAMKEVESFRGHRKDVTALAWHPFNEEYFASGGFDGSIFHWLVGHETPQVDISNAHEKSVSDLAWHPAGHLLCSGSSDRSTKFWCRNRPGDPACEKSNTGLGERNNAIGGRIPGNLPGVLEAPTTPGAFAAGLTRNDGTIPGVGDALPLSAPTALLAPSGAPPLPPGPHPSLLSSNQQKAYQHNNQLLQQHQRMPQPLTSGHQPLLPHPRFPRPPHRLPSLNATSSSIPSSMPSLPIPGPMGTVQMGTRGDTNQMLQPGGGFNRTHIAIGQRQLMPRGLNPYQSCNPNTSAMGSFPPNFGQMFGVPPLLPPGSPPHNQTHW